MSEEADDFLAHFGVQGMKWGKHKAGQAARGTGRALKGAGKAIVKEHQAQRQSVKNNRNRAVYKQNLASRKAKVKAKDHKSITRDEQTAFTKHTNRVQLATRAALVLGPGVLSVSTAALGSAAVGTHNYKNKKAGEAFRRDQIGKIGSRPTASMKMGSNGRWQFANN